MRPRSSTTASAISARRSTPGRSTCSLRTANLSRSSDGRPTAVESCITPSWPALSTSTTAPSRRRRNKMRTRKSPSRRSTAFRLLACQVVLVAITNSLQADEPGRKLTPPEKITSTWDDLTNGINSPADWTARKTDLKRRYLELLRDQYKPAKRPPLDLQ